MQGQPLDFADSPKAPHPVSPQSAHRTGECFAWFARILKFRHTNIHVIQDAASRLPVKSPKLVLRSLGVLNPPTQGRSSPRQRSTPSPCRCGHAPTPRPLGSSPPDRRDRVRQSLLGRDPWHALYGKQGSQASAPYRRSPLGEITNQPRGFDHCRASTESLRLSNTDVLAILKTIMRYVSASEAKQRLAAVLDSVQREPVTIRRQDREVAVVISPLDYQRLTAIGVAEFQRFCDQVSEAARVRGLTEDVLDELFAPYRPLSPLSA